MAPGQSLDREEVSLYRLKIIASDMGLEGARSTTAEVVIKVEDINDSRPRFTTVRQTIEVRKTWAKLTFALSINYFE